VVATTPTTEHGIGPNLGLTPAWTTLNYHPIQWDVWTDPVRFKAVPAGRGSGKTELAKRKLAQSLMYDPIAPFGNPRLYFYGAPTRPQAKRTAWDDLLGLIPKSWIAHADRDVSKSELSIETKFGSRLTLFGLERPERLEGIQWNGGVLDESCDLVPKTFDLNLLPALSWRSGWCWRIGVPKRTGRSAIEYRDYFEAARAGNIKGAMGYTWPSSDIVPKEALEQARATLDPKDYAEQFDAMFQTAGGGIYHCYDDEACVRRCSYDPKLPLIVGSDFNVDPMAWVIGQRRGPKAMEWIGEVWMRDASTPKALDALWARYQQHTGGFQFFGDATGSSRKTSASMTDYAHIYNDDRFTKAGRIVRYPKANPALKDRFASTNAMFKNANGECRMFVDPECVHLRQDLRTRAYKPGTCEPEDRGHDAGHMADAMDYPVWMLFPVQFGVTRKSAPVYVSEGRAA